MQNVTLKVVLVCSAAASLFASTTTFAQGGGNGNGGSGGGGSHGAATAGMTYHSEPVNSPWNQDPSRMSQRGGMADDSMPGMMPDTNAMPAKPVQ
ncbi:hypothetical protein [Paraburkholderia saeva]|jgi:hypothetical protein|uniref:Lipoprotein n=1 Tax=Paraburkholderia saeva TaxID=2777537 RepID=A0A9N8RWI4_9BURK|nr:hypothetical protein [Paraburkholderia saeva]CAG4888420.1 hypothetical protein R52603_00658 [Paraburkholderia saeva]CAG4893296.1 hypothetical protein R70241_01542 [Paraburkholderia saeva]CAG4895678.1 hypothetical protein LMG31841_02202 [Paraburkholderia saeva]